MQLTQVNQKEATTQTLRCQCQNPDRSPSSRQIVHTEESEIQATPVNQTVDVPRLTNYQYQNPDGTPCSKPNDEILHRKDAVVRATLTVTDPNNEVRVFHLTLFKDESSAPVPATVDKVSARIAVKQRLACKKNKRIQKKIRHASITTKPSSSQRINEEISSALYRSKYPQPTQCSFPPCPLPGEWFMRSLRNFIPDNHRLDVNGNWIVSETSELDLEEEIDR